MRREEADTVIGRSSRRIATAAAAALLLAGPTGCSMLDDSESSSGSSSGSSGGGQPAGKTSVDATGKPVAQGTFDAPHATGTTVDLAVMGLKAKGRLATLTVHLTPHRPEGESRSARLIVLHGTTFSASLIDPVNLKRYMPVKDSTGAVMQPDTMWTRATHNNATALVYTFAAPPEDVKAVDVQVGTWPTFRNIPVER